MATGAAVLPWLFNNTQRVTAAFGEAAGVGAKLFKKVGSHRRLLLEGLFAREAKQTKIRGHQLRLLAEQYQELALGFTFQKGGFTR